MISIKDYAKNKGVSYEAVRKQVNRYKDELDGHIHKQNRTQYLDDEAVTFLDSKRAERRRLTSTTIEKEKVPFYKENKTV